MRTLDAREIDSLQALAGRGGIGRATALTDCVAEGPDQLMYIQGDNLILLRDHGKEWLAWCEGEVGWIKRENIDIAVDELASTSGSEKSSFDTPRSDMPATVLISPSSPPPPSGPFHLSPQIPDNLGLPDPRRESGPFEFESELPDKSPISEDVKQKEGVLQRRSGDGGGRERRDSFSSKWRNSDLSAKFSDGGLVGIGGLMMRGGGGKQENSESEDVEQIKDEIIPEARPTSALPPMQNHLTASNAGFPILGRVSPISINSEGSGSDWDIYGDYARDSMYGSVVRAANRQIRASCLSARSAGEDVTSIIDSEDEVDGDRDAAWTALNVSYTTAPSSSTSTFKAPTTTKDNIVAEGVIPTDHIFHDDDDHHGSSKSHLVSERVTPMTLPNRPPRRRPRALTLTPTLNSNMSDPNTPTEFVIKQRSPTPNSTSTISPQPWHGRESYAAPMYDQPHPELNKPFSAGCGRSVANELRLRLQRERTFSPTFSEDARDHYSSNQSTSDSADEQDTVIFGNSKAASSNSSLPTTTFGPLLASPLPPDDPSPTEEKKLPKLSTLDDLLSPLPPPPSIVPRFSPALQQGTWTPNSPASPHSVAATQQAVEVTRSTPDLHKNSRSRSATLVGRVEADLSAAKGPVPITFLIGGSNVPGVHPTEPRTVREGIGLGLPTAYIADKDQISQRHATLPPTPLQTPPTTSRPIQNGRFPSTPIRTLTSPPYSNDKTSAPPPVSAPPPISRPRSRSFSAAFAKAVGKGKKENGPVLIIDTSAPPLPNGLSSPTIMSPPSADSKKVFVTRKASKSILSPDRALSPDFSPPTPIPLLPTGSTSSFNLPQTESQISLPLSSAISSSFSFRNSKIPRKGSKPLPSPVSHKDFADPTVRADGLDFEMIQPRKSSKSPLTETPPSTSLPTPSYDILTTPTTSSSLRPRPETDEWGFIKEKSPTPEIFQSRQAAGDVRIAEQKWLSIINIPLPPGGVAPKKVRKLILDVGVPASLRGRVWAWFMSGEMSARKPGLFQELLTHDRGLADGKIDHDVKTVYLDHSVFCEPNGPGQQDLRSLLRAYSNFAPAGYRHEMALIAGALLIHCVVEDAFWLLAGLVNGVLKTYYAKDKIGLRVDIAVFWGALHGFEPKISKLFKDLCVNCQAFLERWWTTLFIRCLPWPTVLRVFDAVISEGPRFLIVASLAILTLSRERLFSLPPSSRAIIDYLSELPQDGLFLPDHFMKTCEHIKFKDDDLKKIKSGVEKEMGLI